MKLLKKSILYCTLASALTLTSQFSYFTPTLSANTLTTTTTNNNPANEKLITEPTVLPFSDKENKRKWKLSETMSDEFDTPTLDTTKWSGNHLFWKGRQPSCFDSNNVRLEDGKLILRTTYVDTETDAMKEANKNLPEGAKKYENYAASCVMSRQKTGYGYYEIKARTAPISISSAFWFRDPQEAKKEIDVFEQIGRPKNNLAADGSDYPINTHDFTNGEKNQISTPYKYNAGIDLTADYHVYGLEWDKHFLRFYIDGEPVHEIKNASIHQALYAIFDMETLVYDVLPADKEDFKTVDGRYTGDYEIDYFRVWRSDVEQDITPLDVEVNRLPKAKVAIALYGSPNITADSKTLDPIWNTACYTSEMHVKAGKPEVQAKVKTLWDEHYLYVLVDVEDKDLYVDADPKLKHRSDSTELYIDSCNEKVDGPYDANDYYIKIFPDGTNEQHKNTPKDCVLNRIIKPNNSGYYTQYKIPLSTIKENDVIGFDIQINDGNTELKDRIGYIGWNDTRDKAWYSLYTSGNLYFMKLNR